ncbi:MAG: Shedu anti-phage system protein SduA domain-containing protein [Candidatus Paceibacteria bacterium]
MAKKVVKKTPKKKDLGFVTVSNKSYGNALNGTKIYYEGRKAPKGLNKDGTIQFGKHILEALKRKFGNQKFRWIVTSTEDSIKLERGIYRIRTSQETLKRMAGSLRDRTRDIKNDTVANFFSIAYPSHFSHDEKPVYVPGTLSHLLDGKILPRLSSEDRKAMNSFLPEFIASESLNTVNLLKATTQIKTLKELSADLEKALDGGTYTEGWWQTYVKKNILIIQQGYISAIEKMNVLIGGTKYPDFMLVTHDNYLDILEIKKPNTNWKVPQN